MQFLWVTAASTNHYEDYTTKLEPGRLGLVKVSGFDGSGFRDQCDPKPQTLNPKPPKPLDLKPVCASGPPCTRLLRQSFFLLVLGLWGLRLVPDLGFRV